LRRGLTPSLLSEIADSVARLVRTVIFALVYTLHPRASWAITQAFFLALSTLSGCYLVHAANVYGYLAVMKRAPPLGTLWVWSVIELKLPLALLSLGLVGGFLQWGNYSIF
jgi:hypothetical protein